MLQDDNEQILRGYDFGCEASWVRFPSTVGTFTPKSVSLMMDSRTTSRSTVYPLPYEYKAWIFLAELFNAKLKKISSSPGPGPHVAWIDERKGCCEYCTGI